MIRAVIFDLSVGDSHIHSSRTLPRYSHVSLALQLAKYPLAASQLAFYPHSTTFFECFVIVKDLGFGLGLGLGSFALFCRARAGNILTAVGSLFTVCVAHGK